MSMITLGALKHRLMYVEKYTAQFPQSRQGGVFLPTVITFFWVRCCKYSYGYIYPVIFIPKAAANTGRMKAADWGRNSLTWCIPSADFSPTPPPVPCQVTHHHKFNIFSWSIFAALSSSVSVTNTDPILFQYIYICTTYIYTFQMKIFLLSQWQCYGDFCLIILLRVFTLSVSLLLSFQINPNNKPFNVMTYQRPD